MDITWKALLGTPLSCVIRAVVMGQPITAGGPSGAGASLFLSLPAALGGTPAWAAQVLLKASSLPKAVVRSSTTQKGPGRLRQLFQLAAFSGLGDESYRLILQIGEAVSFFETF